MGMRSLLDFEDPLGCLACWEIFAQQMWNATQKDDTEKAFLLSKWLGPNIQETLARTTSLDSSLLSGIVQTLSSLIGMAITFSKRAIRKKQRAFDLQMTPMSKFSLNFVPF